jgi:hypothetical protein
MGGNSGGVNSGYCNIRQQVLASARGHWNDHDAGGYERFRSRLDGQLRNLEGKGTMNKLWLLLLMVIPLQLVHAQQVHHAPTVEQCRADQRLWFSKLEDNSVPMSVSFMELSRWYSEMRDCANVDPDSAARYQYTISEIIAEQADRYAHFIERHHLYGQFLAEDAQGKDR